MTIPSRCVAERNAFESRLGRATAEGDVRLLTRVETDITFCAITRGSVKRQYLILVLLVIGLRVAAATLFPVAGDEAYYWEWSRRLAFGYVDHPPMVAWTIALFDWGAHNALRLRAGFLLCGVIAALATWDFVRAATGSGMRAMLAALAVTSTPLALLAFNLAAPDGPFLAMWIATLAFALRALRQRSMQWWMLAGLALGLTALSRVFAVSLAVGILWAIWSARGSERTNWRGAAVAAIVALIVVTPYVLWNALHGWAGLEFAVSHRHHFVAFSPLRTIVTVVGALACGALFFVPMVARSFVTELRDVSVAGRLLIGSAAPLIAVVLILSSFEPVELYWFAGPMLSLLVLAFIVPEQWDVFRRRAVAALVPTLVLAIVASLLACAPAAAIVRLANLLPPNVSSRSALEIYSDRGLAQALRARYGDSVIVTDEYGLSSMMDFYGGIAPNVIGYNSEGREALRWLEKPHVKQMLYLDHIEVSERPDMLSLLKLACGSLEPMPGIVVREGRFPIHAFSLSRCVNFDSRSVAILNHATR